MLFGRYDDGIIIAVGKVKSRLCAIRWLERLTLRGHPANLA